MRKVDSSTMVGWPFLFSSSYIHSKFVSVKQASLTFFPTLMGICQKQQHRPNESEQEILQQCQKRQPPERYMIWRFPLLMVVLTVLCSMQQKWFHQGKPSRTFLFYKGCFLKTRGRWGDKMVGTYFKISKVDKVLKNDSWNVSIPHKSIWINIVRYGFSFYYYYYFN